MQQPTKDGHLNFKLVQNHAVTKYIKMIIIYKSFIVMTTFPKVICNTFRVQSVLQTHTNFVIMKQNPLLSRTYGPQRLAGAKLIRTRLIAY